MVSTGDNFKKDGPTKPGKPEAFYTLSALAVPGEPGMVISAGYVAVGDNDMILQEQLTFPKLKELQLSTPEAAVNYLEQASTPGKIIRVNGLH